MCFPGHIFATNNFYFIFQGRTIHQLLAIGQLIWNKHGLSKISRICQSLIPFGPHQLTSIHFFQFVNWFWVTCTTCHDNTFSIWWCDNVGPIARINKFWTCEKCLLASWRFWSVHLWVYLPTILDLKMGPITLKLSIQDQVDCLQPQSP